MAAAGSAVCGLPVRAGCENPSMARDRGVRAAPLPALAGLLAGAAGLVLVVLPAQPAAAAAAAAQPDVFVEVSPSTIQAGRQVGIRASCGQDPRPAAVRSGAFGELALPPQPGSRLLVGSATVPSRTQAGQYQVDLRCGTGATASAELYVLRMAQPTRGPRTGGGGTSQAGDARPGGTGPVLVAGAGAAALAAGTGLLVAYRRRSG